MKAVTSSFAGNPRDITKTLKQLSIAADKLGTISAHFFSWPVNPRDYHAPEWVAPLSFEFLPMNDRKVVFCKVLDLDFFVNLFFMRQDDIVLSNTFIFFVLGNKESDQGAGRSLNKVINKDLNRKTKQQSLLIDLHQAIYRGCQDPSLGIYSVEIENKNPSDKRIIVTVSYGEQTPEVLIQTLQS